ncbi:MAG: hypothetical protein Q4C96_10950, partial [Planctomycetia bacterium]|nr:hypothetical protein [Planctomycetia bacterium]
NTKKQRLNLLNNFMMYLYLQIASNDIYRFHFKFSLLLSANRQAGFMLSCQQQALLKMPAFEQNKTEI